MNETEHSSKTEADETNKLYEEAKKLFTAGQYEESEKCYEKIISLGSGNMFDKSVMNLAQILQSTQRREAAINLIKENIKNLSDEYSAYNAMEALYFACKRFDKSLEILQKLLDKNPNDCKLRLRHGLVLYQLRKYEEAERIVKKLITDDGKQQKYGNLLIAIKKARQSGQAAPPKNAAAPTHKRPDIKKIHNMNCQIKSTKNHFLTELSPQRSWTIAIDETGDIFSSEPNKNQKLPNGKFVALILPSETEEITIKKSFHGCYEQIEIIEKGAQNILNTKNTGIIGIDVNLLENVPGDRWRFGITRIIELILRLMPIKENTNINILIEQRGAEPADWRSTTELIKSEFARHQPQKARFLTLKIKEVAKGNHWTLAFADLLAYIWGASRKEVKAILEKSKLLEYCFLSSDGMSIKEIWDQVTNIEAMPVKSWFKALLSSNRSGAEGKLNRHVLKTIKEKCQKNHNLWKKLLKATLKLNESSPLNLELFRQALNWLQECAPEPINITPEIQLSLLGAELIALNYEGKNSEKLCQDLAVLEKELFLDKAPLCCEIALRRAVAATNMYDFEAAREILAPWQKHSVATISRNIWGRLQSQIGQIYAFQEKYDIADQHFNAALDHFSKQTNQEEAQKDIERTGIYKAIAAMDNPSKTASEVKEIIEKISAPILELLEKPEFYKSDKMRYIQHLFLRYLIFKGHKENDMQNKYLEKAVMHQARNPAHPWSLILIYRAILLEKTDIETARQLAKRSVDIIFEYPETSDSPLMNFIGIICAEIAKKMEAPETYTKIGLEDVIKRIPLLEKRAEAINLFRIGEINAIELLSKTLPFNFR